MQQRILERENLQILYPQYNNFLRYMEPAQPNSRTIAEAMVAQQQYMSLCSCQSGEKVMFQCIDTNCPNHHLQRLYCVRCMNPYKHNHLAGTIFVQNQDLSQMWNKLRSDIRSMIESISQFLKTHGDLVQLLDACLTQAQSQFTFAAKFEQLKEFQQQLEQFYLAYVQENSVKGEILKLQEVNQQLELFQAKLSEVSYMSEIGAKALWRFHSEVLHMVSPQRVLESMSIDNVKIYLRLRLQRIQLQITNLIKKPSPTPQDYINTLNDATVDQAQIYLMNELNQIVAQNELDSQQILKVDALRSELDSIGVSLMFALVKNDFEHLRGTILEQQATQIAQLQAYNQELEQRIERQFRESQAQNDAILRQQTEDLQQKAENEKLERIQIEKRLAIIEEEKRLELMIKFEDSVILSDVSKKKQVEQYFKQNLDRLCQANLLFRGSRDGYTATDFHRLCDNKGPTITIIKTNCGRTIGGYTAQNWDQSSSYKNDSSAWLFNLSYQNRFKVSSSSNANYGGSSYGPTFGGGHDLYMVANFKQGCSCSAHSYNYEGQSNILQGASSSFTTLEVEVYGVTVK
ncbi:hypothetical protein FGO68_gene11154 [Halteria grandinella]|uniref:TLDc domain-containing protein n=1 Tax=Halteria grandinella TaxID=5974 RepID=A0A8J8NT14_HALGN|nr:hypothetical protein FGO68_gene11154 [Halteria grandinella]